MKKIIILLSCLFISQYIFAQDYIAETVKADSLVKVLKTMGLLVRLKTSDNLINSLNMQGRKAEAEKTKAERRVKNMEIYKAFRKYYTFGPVYFFNSSASNYIKEHKIKGHLVNDSLEEDSTIKYPKGDFFVCEIGNIPSHTNSSSTEGLHLMTFDFHEVNVAWKHQLQSVGTVDVFRLKLRQPSDMIIDFNTRLKKYSE